MINQGVTKRMLRTDIGLYFSAALHHPDKVSNFQDQGASEAFFVHLKLAQDTLISPTKRFAYDRFGPDMLQWQHCSSVRDFLLAGLQAFVPLYVGPAVFMILLGVAGYLQWGRFVRCHSHV